MKKIAVFRSQAFDTSWPEDGADPNTPPLGRDLALYLCEEMRKTGVRVDDPLEGDDCWLLDAEVGGESVALAIHWAPLGKSPADWWVIEPMIRQSVLASLLGREADTARLSQTCSIIKGIVERLPSVRELQWLDENELAAKY